MPSNTLTHLNDVKTVLVAIEFAICIAVLPPMIYSIIRFRQLSYSIMIQKRHPNLLRIEAVLIVLIYAIVFPFMALDWSYLQQFEGTTQSTFTLINSTIYPPISFGNLLIILWRFWHILYDLKYASSQKNSEWKYYLDPNLVENNFWLTKRKTFGSPRYTKTPVIIFYCVNILLIVSVYHATIDTEYTWIAHCTSLFSHGLVIVGMVIIMTQVPKFKDDFFIKDELKIIAMSLLINQGFTCIIIVCGALFDLSLILLCGVFSASIVIFMSGASSFWWIPRKIRAKENENGEVKRTGFDTKSYGLSHVLCNGKTFKMFMQHLCHEVSTESLLCFVEIVQFKHALKERFDIVDSDAIPNEATYADKYQWFGGVCLSAIIRDGFADVSKYEENEVQLALIDEAKDVCLRLFRKYVEVAAELTVNISGEDRARLLDLMSDESVWREMNIAPKELYCLYDDVAMSMINLMHGSFMRFVRKPSFKKVCLALILDENHSSNTGVSSSATCS
eukprot:70142_1